MLQKFPCGVLVTEVIKKEGVEDETTKSEDKYKLITGEPVTKTEKPVSFSFNVHFSNEKADSFLKPMHDFFDPEKWQQIFRYRIFQQV